ncbi:MAG: hypothetical protein LW717_00805 [Chloroflexaceae bacterium]|nr:hypothetical protein [Chloroflexaceae bacterium]
MNEDSTNHAWSETARCALMVYGDQLALLRDLFATQPVDLFLYDTSESALIEDTWKPWARRIRPQLKQRTGKLVVCAPACIFPDQHNHPLIRASLAQQLQAICDVAVTLEADAIFLPIEAGIPIFRERINHYVTLLHERISAQQMQLIVHAGAGSDLQALSEMLAGYTPAIRLCDHDTAYGEFQWHITPTVSRRTTVTIMGPFNDANTCRAAWHAWDAAPPEPAHTTDDSQADDVSPPADQSSAASDASA